MPSTPNQQRFQATEDVMVEQVPRVVIGMDPHKRSVTIEVMLADESVVGGGRFDTTVDTAVAHNCGRKAKP